MRPVGRRNGLILCLFLWSSTLWAVPETINIQGNLSDSNGNPMVGTRAYRVQFFDSAEGGASLGAAINGFVTPSAAGRFSIDIVPPSEAFTATEVYYSLGIDSGNPTDGSVDAQDVFPNRVKVNSVLFARMAERAASADTAAHALSADSAATALTLEGVLTNPGDQIPLGGGVFLQVGPDGKVEFRANGHRLRLAGQKWFDPRDPFDNINLSSGASYPEVAMNDRGDAVIVWSQPEGIYRTEFRGASWSDPVRISPEGLNSAGRHRVALNEGGEAIIVWSQFDGATVNIYRSEYRNGSWIDPTELADNISPNGTSGDLASVALSDNGEAVIVWNQSDGANEQIFRSEYRNGFWDDPTLLSDNISPGGQNAMFPDVDLNDSGQSVIVWHQNDGSNTQIFRSEYSNGAWSDPSSLTDNFSPDGQNATSPHVDINNSGEALIVWNQSDGSNNQIFRSEYREGVWNDPTSLSDNISPDGQSVTGMPDVALNDDGEGVIVWTQSDGSNPQIFRSEYREGSWIDPKNLADNISPGGQSAGGPDVAINSIGDSVVVWLQSVGTDSQIFRSEYRNGVWAMPTDLSDNISPDGTLANNPRVALNSNGDAIIVWSGFVDGDFKIYRSEYRFGY